MLTVLGRLAEFERELIRARTGEGYTRAKARGVKLGRKPKLTTHQKREALERRERGDETLAEIGRELQLDREHTRTLCAIAIAIASLTLAGAGALAFSDDDLTDIIDASRTNEIRFDNIYKGKKFVTSGVLVKATDDGYVSVKTQHGNIYCFGSKYDQNWTGGQSVGIFGTIEKTLLGDLKLYNGCNVEIMAISAADRVNKPEIYSDKDMGDIMRLSTDNKRFETTYKGKLFGDVGVFDELWKVPIASGNYDVYVKMRTNRVMCEVFDKQSITDIANWHVGNRVQIRGSINGTSLGDLILGYDCRVISAP